MGAAKPISKNYREARAFLEAALARAPVPGNRVQVMRSVGVVPKTYLHVDADDQISVQYGDAPLITYRADESIELHMPPTVVGPDGVPKIPWPIIAARVNRFSPFLMSARPRADEDRAVEVPTLLPSGGGTIHAVKGGHDYIVRGWMYRGGMKLVRDATGVYSVIGTRPVGEERLRRMAVRTLNGYVNSYLNQISDGSLNWKRQLCKACLLETDGTPLVELLGQREHWWTHISNRQYPPSLICRLLPAIRPRTLMRVLAVKVNRCFQLAEMSWEQRANYRKFRTLTAYDGLVLFSDEEHRILTMAMADYLRPIVEGGA